MIGSGHMINFNHLLMAKSNSTLARSRVFRGFKSLKQGTCAKAKTSLLLGIWLWWRKCTLNLRLNSNYTNIRRNGWPLTKFRYPVLWKFNGMKGFILFNSQSITISITNMSAINQLRKTSFLNNKYIFNELQYVLKKKLCSQQEMV